VLGMTDGQERIGLAPCGESLTPGVNRHADILPDASTCRIGYGAHTSDCHACNREVTGVELRRERIPKGLDGEAACESPLDEVRLMPITCLGHGRLT